MVGLSGKNGVARRTAFDPGWIDRYYRKNLTDNLSPQNLKNILAQVDQGDLGALVQMDLELQVKDAHLQAVVNTRRLAVSALDWSIVPNESTGDSVLAADAAKYCEETLRGLATWEETIEHLTSAIGPNIAASRLVWRGLRLVGTEDVPGQMLWVDVQRDGRLYVLPPEHYGSVRIPITHGDYVVHHPRRFPGAPIYFSMIRAAAWLHVIKHYAVSDWTAFLEMFGIPWRVVHTETGAPDSRKDALSDLLKNFGSDGYAVLDKADEIELVEPKGTTVNPFLNIVEWAETKQTILFLGQTLTTDVGGVGSYAAARVHDNVRRDLLVADLNAEKRTIGKQVLLPMVRNRWRNLDVPVPVFRRKIIELYDVDRARVTMDQIRLAQQSGLSLDREWIHQVLGIPLPKGGYAQ